MFNANNRIPGQRALSTRQLRDHEWKWIWLKLKRTLTWFTTRRRFLPLVSVQITSYFTLSLQRVSFMTSISCGHKLFILVVRNNNRSILDFGWLFTIFMLCQRIWSRESGDSQSVSYFIEKSNARSSENEAATIIIHEFMTDLLQLLKDEPE